MILLTREWDTPYGMFGRIVTDTGSLWSLECPWKDNEPFSSCIPPGEYEIKPDTFRGLYPSIAVLSVLNRSAIEFHRGNTVEDTHGCILPGKNIGCVHGHWAVMESREALEQIVDVVPRDGTVLYVFGVGDTRWQRQSPSF